MNLKEAGKLANSTHVTKAIESFRLHGLDWLLTVTGRSTPKFRYSVVDGERVPTKAFGFLVAQIAGDTDNCSNDMTVNEAAAVLKRAAGIISVVPGRKVETSDERNARLESYYCQLARPGQAIFRERLMLASNGTCAITGCDVAAALEAAHIRPFARSRCDDVENGILLRTDVHRLFDANHLAINPNTGQVSLIDPCHSHYASLSGQLICLPTEQHSLCAFKERWDTFNDA